MDYRNRKYYLLKMSYVLTCNYDDYICKLQKIAPSLKISSPYNHVYINNFSKVHDHFWHGQTNVDWPNMMVSCKKEEAVNLENELNSMRESNKSAHVFGGCLKYFELTKDFCKQ